MLKHGWIFLGILPWFLAGIAHAVVPEVNLTLAQAEEQALAFSPALKAKRAELAASEAKVDAQTALLWPRLTLEGSWRYVTEVPELSILPGRPALPFGDHNNYSVGPMLSWNFWDAGGAYYARLTARSAQQAKADEVQGLERSLKLQVRTAYFQAQMASAQVRLLVDAFKLFNAQYQDIRTQYRAGASTRIDSLSSHQDLLSSQRQL
ncbi:MAG: TolC family protein, partial [Candidatus Firestonebacteria bacterium]|nr:TolC family protein [Candidatus Firestonebacteria bacterium]